MPAEKRTQSKLSAPSTKKASPKRAASPKKRNEVALKIVKYDDASWHYGGTYPSDLPPEAAATHIGMFLAWCLLKGMGSDELRDDYGTELKKLTMRKLTPGGLLLSMDEKFCSDDLDAEGNAFTLAYYQGKSHDSRYVDDYFAAFKVDEATLYGVPDTWKTFDTLAGRIARRHAAWVKAGRPKYV